ncbi:hypothetical protein, partial [Escherichia coli]|uniref:hypothetical protein n=1 Tax=Escherichia coli TaxID=562 RepID=UPI001953EE9F
VVPAMEDRRSDDVFEGAERPVEIGVNERRMEDGERSKPEHHVRGDAREQQRDVDGDSAQHDVDGME